MLEAGHRWSDLHQDTSLPWDFQRAVPQFGEYREYSATSRERHDPAERPLIERISQLGVDVAALKAAGRDLRDLTEVEYGELVRTALQKHCETVVVSVFTNALASYFSWGHTAQEREALAAARAYQRWGLTARPGAEPGQFQCVVGIEGMDWLYDTNQVRHLLDAGVKIFAPQYSPDKETWLVKDFRLTTVGRQIARMILEHGAAIDLAHATYMVRQDLMDIAESMGRGRQLAYTHGSLLEDAASDPVFGEEEIGRNPERFITPSEVHRLSELGGIVGLAVIRPFFGSVEKIAERINETIQTVDNGVSVLAIGTDFGGMPPQFLLPSLQSPADLIRLAEVLSEKFGISDANIDRVMRENATKWVRQLTTPES